MVWAATGETPTWQVLVGASGILVTMSLESWMGLRESVNGEAATKRRLVGEGRGEGEEEAAAVVEDGAAATNPEP